MSTKRFILGLCGGKWGDLGVGKTSVANILEQKMGFHRVSLLNPVENVAKNAFGWNGLRDENGLRLLDRICRSGRLVSEDYWLNIVLTGLGNIKDPVVMDDVYFPNEVKFIKESGGKVLKISKSTSCQEDRGLVPDAEIQNDGSLQSLEREVLVIVGDLKKIS